MCIRDRSLEELKSQLETQQEEKKQAEDALDETTDDTERRRLLLDIRNYNNEMQKTNCLLYTSVRPSMGPNSGEA